MKAGSQLLVAVRLLSTVDDLCARLNIFSNTGRAHLYCINDKIVFIEFAELFPVSWLFSNRLSDVGGALRTATTTEQKVKTFMKVSENPDLLSSFTEVVRKHLSEFLSTELTKCELKPEPLPEAPEIIGLAEVIFDCSPNLLQNLSVEGFIPNDDVPFQLANDYMRKLKSLKLNPQQGFLLSRLDQPLALRDILSAVPGQEDSIRRDLLTLWAFGVLDSTVLNQVVPRVATQVRAEVSPTRTSEKLAEEHREQMELIRQTYDSLSKKDFYTLFSISPRAELAEIKSAYYRLARMFHPDRYYAIQDPLFKERVDIIFSTINIAYETLKNAKSRQAYDNAPLEQKRIGIATTIVPDSTHTNENKKAAESRTAEDFYARAKKSHGSGNYYEAVQFLRSATQIAPDVAKYWRQLGVSLSKNEQWRKEAEDSFQRAVELEPKNPENHLHLGFLYKNSGLKLRAKRSFMNVLEINPGHDLAKIEVEELDAEEQNIQQKKGLLGGIFKKK